MTICRNRVMVIRYMYGVCTGLCVSLVLVSLLLSSNNNNEILTNNIVSEIQLTDIFTIIIYDTDGEQDGIMMSLINATWGYNNNIIYTLKQTNNMIIDIITILQTTTTTIDSQWYIIMTNTNTYIDIHSLETILYSFNCNSLLYYNNGIVLLMSKGLLKSLYDVYNECNITMIQDNNNNNKNNNNNNSNCLITEVERSLSVTPSLKSSIDRYCCTRQQFISNQQPPLLCIFITQLTSPQLLYDIHHLITINKLHQSFKKIEMIQQEINILSYQLIGMENINNGWEEHEITKMWVLGTKESVMSFNGETPVINNWSNDFITEGIDEVMNIIKNTATIAVSYYYRFNSNGLRLILNMEQERGYDTINYQLYLERHAYNVRESELVNNNNRLTIIIIISVQQRNNNELKHFIDTIITIKKRIKNELRLLIIIMDDTHTNTINENILNDAIKHIAIETITTSHQLSKSYGLSLALNNLHGNDIVLLADINVRFSHGFLSRCVSYPARNQRIYRPHPLINHDDQHINTIISQLHVINYWHQYSDNGIMCIYAIDLITAITNNGDNIILNDKSYQIIVSPDHGLEWNYRNEDCQQCTDNECVGGLITSYYTTQLLI